MQLAHLLYQGENLNTALDAVAKTTAELVDRVAAASRFDQLKDIVGSASFNRMLDESQSDWRELIEAGYDPRMAALA